MNPACVLMYHGLTDSNLPSTKLGTSDPAYLLKRSIFEGQMRYLSEQQIKACSLRDKMQNREEEDSPVVITFDDGNVSDRILALPILLQFGFTASIYVTTAWTGRPGFLSETDIRALADAGMEIGSHGHTHRYFDDLSESELTDELEASTSMLTEILGSAVTSLAAPGGRLHPKLESVASQFGIETITTSRFGLLRDGSSHFSVPRVPVQANTTSLEFEKIVATDRGYFRHKKLRQLALEVAKRTLGNNKYDQLRNFLLRHG